MKSIRLSTDYGCWPLWWHAGAEPDNIDPSDLPLSAETQAALVAWAGWFERGLDMNDPAASPGMSESEEAAFEQEGVRLWLQMSKELKGQYEVVYRSKRHQRVYNTPSEYP